MKRLSSSRLALSGAIAVATLAAHIGSAVAFEDDWRDRRLETPLGFDSTGDVERGIRGNRDELGRKIEITGPYGSTLATALGNSISVEAGAGATVVINAQQINRGNQKATTIVDGDVLERMFQTEPAAGPAR